LKTFTKNDLNQNDEIIKETFVDVTYDGKRHQYIRFVKKGTTLVTGTHDGRMIKFVNIMDAKLTAELTRGKNSAEISGISVKNI
jgi:hypothetical protein